MAVENSGVECVIGMNHQEGIVLRVLLLFPLQPSEIVQSLVLGLATNLRKPLLRSRSRN